MEVQIIYQVVDIESMTVLSTSSERDESIELAQKVAKELSISSNLLYIRECKKLPSGFLEGSLEPIDQIAKIADELILEVSDYASEIDSVSLILDDILDSLVDIRDGNGNQVDGKFYGNGILPLKINKDTTLDDIREFIVSSIEEQSRINLQVLESISCK